jgi:hypothetical protein
MEIPAWYAILTGAVGTVVGSAWNAFWAFVADRAVQQGWEKAARAALGLRVSKFETFVGRTRLDGAIPLPTCSRKVRKFGQPGWPEGGCFRPTNYWTDTEGN